MAALLTSILPCSIFAVIMPPESSILGRDDFVPTNFGPDCDWAKKYSPNTYLQCNSTISYPNLGNQKQGALRYPTLSYWILMTGTGQNVSSWCTGILGAIKETCGLRLVQNPECIANTNSFGTYALDGDNDWKLVANAGLQLRFDLVFGRYSFSGIDHDHKCMAEAIRAGTCNGITIFNGATCVSTDYEAPELDDSDNESTTENEVPGPAVDPFKDQ
jgi:hypothetical protein